MTCVRWLPLVALLAGCAPTALPAVERPWESESESDAAERPWPVCSRLVIDALETEGPAGIARAASQGANFMCVADRTWGLPLDVAIREDRPDRVLALLRAGADPNGRYQLDRAPLRTAIDKQWGLPPPVHRSEIVALLLRHGADPNVRWCPFETRMGALPHGPCSTKKGVTALMTAVAFDQADVVALLLDAGADPEPEDWTEGNAFNFAVSRGVMTLLLSRVFPDPVVRQRESLAYLSRRALTSSLLADALYGDLRSRVIPVPRPPPPGDTSPPPPYPPLDRLHLVLGLGADPNERTADPVIDWPPLARAMSPSKLPHAEVLLQYGADPDQRWCAHPWTRRRDADCVSDTGLTPLMWAHRLGLDDFAALLLKYGADASARDSKGRTATDFEAEPPPWPRRE